MKISKPMAHIKHTKKLAQVKSKPESQINWPVVGPIIGILFLLLLWVLL